MVSGNYLENDKIVNTLVCKLMTTPTFLQILTTTILIPLFAQNTSLGKDTATLRASIGIFFWLDCYTPLYEKGTKQMQKRPIFRRFITWLDWDQARYFIK